jgi:NTE family protein
MLHAVIDRNIRFDLVLGSSVGALNGAFYASDPTPSGVQRLEQVWMSLRDQDIFGTSLAGRVANLVRSGTYLHAESGLRSLVERNLPRSRIEDLPVRFECVAASIQRAAAHWFTEGPVADAVLASCAVPGLLPPVEIAGEHYLDGGLVNSVPVGRAVAHGARRVFVLHVGRLDRRLDPPKRPWELGLVVFEIARRHRFVEDMAALPGGVEVLVLPNGSEAPPVVNLRYRRVDDVTARIEAAYEAATRYLEERLVEP